MRPDLGHDLVRELRPSVVHDEHDGGHLQLGIETATDEIDVAEQLPQTLQRVVLALDGDEHLAGGGQAVDGQETQRRGTVDEEELVVVLHHVEGPPETEFTAECRDQLDLGAGEVQAGRSDEEVLHRCRLHAVLERELVHDHVVHRVLEVAGVEAEAGGGVALRIEVHDERPMAEVGE
jgi:hypothetical protein